LIPLPVWNTKRTAALKDDIQKVVVTHPFSPYKGKEYDVLDMIYNWDMLLCRGDDGNIRTFLTKWTDYPSVEPENPFTGTIDFWVQDLQMLAKLISDIKKV